MMQLIFDCLKQMMRLHRDKFQFLELSNLSVKIK